MFSFHDQHPITLDKLTDYSAIKQDEQDIKKLNDTAYNSKEKSIGFRMIFSVKKRSRLPYYSKSNNMSLSLLAKLEKENKDRDGFFIWRRHRLQKRE